MKKFVLLACVLAFCRDANADVIIGNSVNGPTYLNGTNTGKKSLGFRTGSSAVALDNIQVALGGTQGGGAGGKVVFTLNADAGGLPGAVIATIGQGTVVNGFEPTKPYTIAPASGLPLSPNTTYWIQATFISDPVTNGSADWDQPNPKVAPSSPSALATFVGYVFDGGSGPVTSTTYNAIVVNGHVVDRSRGTAGRAILTGARCGSALTLDDLRGDFAVDTFSTVDRDHVGWSGAAGVQATAPRVGAYVSTNNLVATATGTALGVGVGGTRAIAFRAYRNDTGFTQAPPATATLDGEFSSAPNLTFRSGLCGSIDATASGNPGHATAAVYVFDATMFLNAFDASARSLPDFLLGSDTLDDYRAGTASRLSLTRFPSLSAASMGEQFMAVDPATFVAGTTLGPPLVFVTPGQAVIVVFDISAYSPPGSTVQFIDTLKPAPGFMAGMTPIGAFTPEPPAAASLTLTPTAATNPITTPVTVTATATTLSGAPVPNTIVLFDMSTGPNAQPLGPALTDANGQVSFTYAGGANAGTDIVRASIGSLQSNVAAMTWTTPGPLDHIAVSPGTATIAAGGSQSYAAQALDVFEHAIGDVTAGTTFTIAPNGSCAGATCTASIAGPHTVTADYHGMTATATLDVTSGTSTYEFQGFYRPVDMSTPAQIVWNTVKAGQAVPLKWLLTKDGVPVSNPASFERLLSSPAACSYGAGSIDDAIDQIAVGGSGLQYNGEGNWQFNWKTPASDKGTCRAVAAKFNDGTTSPVAYFKFK